MKKNELEILLLIGIPASGKSTWSKEFVHKNANYVRVNRDMYRLMLKDAQVCEPKVEDLISGLVNQAIEASLMKKLNVIVDATNLKVKYIKEFVERFKYRADINYRVFDISLDKAIERDNAREAKVGEAVIKKMYNDYKVLIDTFDFQPVKKVMHRPVVVPNFKAELPDAVVFDIDGTLALMGDRGPFDWLRVHKDDVNSIVSEQIEFHRSRGRKILVVSGRDAICRKITEDWLDMYGITYDALFMRPEGDYRKDTLIKREIYENEIKDRYNLLAVYDDRLQVLEMWNKLGIFAFNVNQGNINF